MRIFPVITSIMKGLFLVCSSNLLLDCRRIAGYLAHCGHFWFILAPDLANLLKIRIFIHYLRLQLSFHHNPT